MISFRSQITQKLLQYFFVNPQEKQYINELARILDVNVANLDKKLKELEKEGVLLHEVQGKQKYYSVNKKYPLLKEIQKLFERSYGLPQKLKELLSSLPGIQEAYIFGSYAKKTFQSESDIDIIVIGNHSVREVQKAILPLQNQLQREINVVSLSPEECTQKRTAKDPFLTNVFTNPLIRVI